MCADTCENSRHGRIDDCSLSCHPARTALPSELRACGVAPLARTSSTVLRLAGIQFGCNPPGPAVPAHGLVRLAHDASAAPRTPRRAMNRNRRGRGG